MCSRSLAAKPKVESGAGPKQVRQPGHNYCSMIKLAGLERHYPSPGYGAAGPLTVVTRDVPLSTAAIRPLR